MSELTLIRRAAPATTAPSAHARDYAAARLERRIAAERRRRHRLLLPVGGLAAAAAAATALVIADLGTRATDSAAAAVLERTAAAARAQPATQLGRREFLYIRSIDAYLATRVDAPSYSYLVPHVREVWLGRDHGRLRSTTGDPTFLSERDRARWVAAGRPPLLGEERVTDMRIRSRTVDIPADADDAYAKLAAQARAKDSSFAWAMFQLIADAFRETLTTPAQRAALFGAAARVPEIELVGEVTDRAGRRGVAIAVRDDANVVRLQLIIDPDDGRLLGEEELVLEGNMFGYSAGTVIGYATYTHTAVVAGDHARPADVSTR